MNYIFHWFTLHFIYDHDKQVLLKGENKFKYLYLKVTAFVTAVAFVNDVDAPASAGADVTAANAAGGFPEGYGHCCCDC